MTELQAYQDILADCRFCPMCKPAAEVANIRKIESYSTRSRSMMLWRIAAGQREWTERSIELLYESTLDGISEAFCVSDRPVSGYVLAARRDVWAAGLAPVEVREAVSGVSASPTAPDVGERVLVAGECAEVGWIDPTAPAAEALGLDVLTIPVGATAYALGASDVAADLARAAAKRLTRATVVVADGPQTQWMISRIWPELGVTLDASVWSLPAYTLEVMKADDHAPALGECYLVEARAAAYLADRLAKPVAIQPGYLGAPEDSGEGAVYDDLRALLGRLGGTEQRHRWERTLARSCGADDGLWATYPEHAAALARDGLDRALEAGAQRIVTDSPLSAAWLAKSTGRSLPVSWIGQLVSAG